jgi:hypothetical protein
MTAAKVFAEPIVTAVEPAEEFHGAETYHQNYYNENSRQPYCMFVISPKLAKLEKKFAAKLRALPGSSQIELSPESSRKSEFLRFPVRLRVPYGAQKVLPRRTRRYTGRPPRRRDLFWSWRRVPSVLPVIAGAGFAGR